VTDEYELMPADELAKLRHEIEVLKANPFGKTKEGKTLLEAVIELTNAINRLIKLFTDVEQEVVQDFEKSKTLTNTFNQLVSQNEQIAAGIVALADMVRRSQTTLPPQGPTQPPLHNTPPLNEQQPPITQQPPFPPPQSIPQTPPSPPGNTQTPPTTPHWEEDPLHEEQPLPPLHNTPPLNEQQPPSSFPPPPQPTQQQPPPPKPSFVPPPPPEKKDKKGFLGVFK